MKRRKLYTDTNTYNSWKKKEDEMFKILSKLETIAEDALGTDPINDYEHFLQNTEEYLIAEYWFRWGSKHNAPHADATIVFENSTRTRVSEVTDLKVKFQKAFEAMSSYIPTVNALGVHSNLKIEQFDKFLHKDKAKEFDALNNFLDAAKEIEQYGARGYVNLLRFANNNLMMEGLEAKVNLTKFI